MIFDFNKRLTSHKINYKTLQFKKNNVILTFVQSLTPSTRNPTTIESGPNTALFCS